MIWVTELTVPLREDNTAAPVSRLFNVRPTRHKAGISIS
jgi:hypothetical protein